MTLDSKSKKRTRVSENDDSYDFDATNSSLTNTTTISPAHKKRRRNTTDSDSDKFNNCIIDRKNTSDYFSSYDDLSIHKLMLSDKPRNDAYVDAIKKHKHQIKNRVCLDIGTGSGFLALLLCKLGGAKHVFAIEACDKMSKVAESLVEKNGLKERITIVNKRAEEVELRDLLFEKDISKENETNDNVEADLKLNQKPIDVIISEWMGFFLLHESMIESVLLLRDKFLNLESSDSLILPSHCRMWSSPIDYKEQVDSEKNQRFSKQNFYGLSGFDEVFDQSVEVETKYVTGTKKLKHKGRKGDSDENNSSNDSTTMSQRFNDGSPMVNEPINSWDLIGMPEPSADHNDIDHLVAESDSVSTLTTSSREPFWSKSVAGSYPPLYPSDSSNTSVKTGFSNSSTCFKYIDLYSCSAKDLQHFTSGEMRFSAKKEGSVGAVGVWFDCLFMRNVMKMVTDDIDNKKSNVNNNLNGIINDTSIAILDTSPYARPTHWFQTVIWIRDSEDESNTNANGVSDVKEPSYMKVRKGQLIRYSLEFKQAIENSRFYEITLEMR